MARQDDDREDLLREATALVYRAEITLESRPVPITFGFRRNGCFSIYFGAEPAYHFNSRGELRRAYLQGRLLKAEAGALIGLTRIRSESETVLLSQRLREAEQSELLAAISASLQELRTALAENRYQLVGQFPADSGILADSVDWLAKHSASISIAQRPHAD